MVFVVTLQNATGYSRRGLVSGGCPGRPLQTSLSSVRLHPLVPGSPRAGKLVLSQPKETRMPWWCGSWGRKTPGYPIGQSSIEMAEASSNIVGFRYRVVYNKVLSFAF